jgi:hypothetical protein
MDEGGALVARWLTQESASVEDMPERLVNARDDKTERERLAWLERHNLAFIDFLSWTRAQDPAARRRPPSKRWFMSAEELAAFDAQRKQAGEPRW